MGEATDKVFWLVIKHSPGGQGVNPHVLVGPVSRQVFRQPDQAVLNHRISNELHRLLVLKATFFPVDPLIRGDYAQVGGDVEHNPAAAVCHPGAHFLAADKSPGQTLRQIVKPQVQGEEFQAAPVRSRSAMLMADGKISLT